MHRASAAQHGVQQVQRAGQLGLVADADLHGLGPRGVARSLGQRHHQLVRLVAEWVARDREVEAVGGDVGPHAQRHVGAGHAQGEEAVVVGHRRGQHGAGRVHGVHGDAPRGAQRLGP